MKYNLDLFIENCDIVHGMADVKEKKDAILRVAAQVVYDDGRVELSEMLLDAISDDCLRLCEFSKSPNL
jgi:hypothetical protein